MSLAKMRNEEFLLLQKFYDKINNFIIYFSFYQIMSRYRAINVSVQTQDMFMSHDGI